MAKLITKTTALTLLATSFGVAVGACAGNAVLAPSSAQLVNTIVGALQGGLICGLAAFLSQRLAARTYKISDLIALTLLVAVIVASVFLPKRDAEISKSGFSTDRVLTASNPVVKALHERRHATESYLDSAIRAIQLQGHRHEATYSVYRQGLNKPEAWEFHIEVSRNDGMKSTLVVNTQVSVAGNADHGTIEPIKIRPALNTLESQLFDSTLSTAFEAQNWIHEILAIEPDAPLH
jgi:hypothetical protein